jgi:hypothetical protein
MQMEVHRRLHEQLEVNIFTFTSINILFQFDMEVL